MVDGKTELRNFLSTIDVTKSTWPDEIETFVCDVWAKKHASRRVPTFSVGDDDFDEVSECLQNETGSEVITQEVGIQCKRDDETLEVAPGSRSFDLIKEEWKNGVVVTPGEAIRLLKHGAARHRELESHFSYEDAIEIRRKFINKNYSQVPFKSYDYKYVVNSCCENVIGYIPVPVGIAGPVLVNGAEFVVPMATTEGALIASTNRGFSAIKMVQGGVEAKVYNSGMTRAPVVKFPTARQAVELKEWLDNEENKVSVKTEFESSSRFAKLREVTVTVDGNLAFVRFVATTGDAMGMNMVSKGCSIAMKLIAARFPEMTMMSLSGNYCVDKKAAALNWTTGRGRSVTADCIIPAQAVQSVLKTTPKLMTQTAQAKLQIGSARAGCIGGSNAHAANIVAAIFIATGQDAAQVVSSSMCSTRLEETPEGDLYASVTLPCLEVATVGGGTILPPQNSCLQSLGCAGPAAVSGANAERLAEVIAATVLAGELSLMAALVTEDLVRSHMKLNRSKLQLYNTEGTRTKLDKDIEKIESLFKGSSLKLKRCNEKEQVQCSNIL